MTPSVGTRLPRTDARGKVTGTEVYVGDIVVPGMLHGVAVRSPHAHARIVSVDTSAAVSAPGVEAVVTGADFPHLFGGACADQPFLAIDRVRYAGEPVVAIAAETEQQARAAAALVEVVYEELPAVLDPLDALAADAPLVHPDLHTYAKGGHRIVPHTNVNTLWTYQRGDVDAALAGADLVVTDTFTSHAVSPAAMEPHTSVASYDPIGGGYTLWVSTDRPFQVRSELTAALGLPSDKVRLVVAAVGGSFGGKNTLISETISVPLARFTGGRPVRVEFSRAEDLVAATTRVPAVMTLTTGVTSDGTILARRAEVVWDSGAYTCNTPGVAIRGASTIIGPYRVPHVAIESRQVYTNRPITGSYRGYGTMQVTWACESQMDMIADRLGLDPVQVRLRNAYVEGDPYINGQVMHGVGLRETLERSAAEIEWGTVDRAPAPHLRRGKGIATMLKPTATPTSANAVVKVEQDGRVTVLAAAPEIGGGQHTVLAQMAADAIGVPVGDVVVPGTDTAFTPYNGPVASSRTTYHVGQAVAAAGEQVRGKILDAAAELLGIGRDHLDLADGVILGDGAPVTTLRELQRDVPFLDDYAFTGEARVSTSGSPLLKAPHDQWLSSIFWMFATHAVEIEVDIETGRVRVLKVAAAQDVGRAINPTTVEQQIEGGVIMGISNALYEHLPVSERGSVLVDGFTDYKVAAFPDVPEIVPIVVESPHDEAPFGAKGVGEPGAAPTAAAIANALFDAIGVRLTGTPLTAERILEELASRRADEPEGH